MKVQRIYENLTRRVFPERKLVPRLVEDPRAGGGRHYGYYDAERHVIGYAPDLEEEPAAVIRGILAHEIGHALIELWNIPVPSNRDLSERQADMAAEGALGLHIYYDDEDVQRAGRGARGTRPRPLGVR